MSPSRFAVLALAAFAFSACSDPTTPATTPDSPTAAFAKGGKLSPSRDPVLLDYWVIPGTGAAPDVLHIVGEGAVAFVDPSVVYDYFFNGLRDDDPPDDAHYELIFQGPPTVPVVALADGLWRVDIPWDGRLANDDPNDKAPNHTSIEIPGEGDPWVFQLKFINAAGKSLGVRIPRGIVIDGVENDPATIEGLDPANASVTIRSYATFVGSEPEGQMHLTGIGMNVVDCSRVTLTSGKGKDRTVETTYELTAELTVAVERDFSLEEDAGLSDMDSHVWWEGHVQAVGGAFRSARMIAPNAGIFNAHVTMPSSWPGSGDIEFVVDFLSGLGLTRHIVYDPWANDPSILTTAGFGLTPVWTSARTGLGYDADVPVAHSPSVSVTCQ